MAEHVDDYPSTLEKKGFTLVELLLVIAVIAILAGLLLPALTQAKARAKIVRCAGNLRQLGLALNMYVHDFSRYPLTGSGPQDPPVLWFDVLVPYSGSTWTNSLYQCPASKMRAQDRVLSILWSDGSIGLTRPSKGAGIQNISAAGDYGYNTSGSGWLRDQEIGLGLGSHWGWRARSKELRAVSESSIAIPSQMIALGDSAYQNALFIWPKLDGFRVPSAHAEIYGFRVQLAHQSGANHVFCDGHVEFGKSNHVYASTPEARRRWNRDNQPHPETW